MMLKGLTNISEYFREKSIVLQLLRVNCICPWSVQREVGEPTKDKDIYFPNKFREVLEEVLTEHGFIQ